MDEKEIKELLDKYKEGTATEEERALLESWYLTYEEQGPADLSMDERVKAVDKVWAKLEGRTVRLWPRIAAAAAILILFSVGIYFYHHKETVIAKQDVAPGSNKAMLTLTNGKTINLSNLKTGVVINASALTYDDGTRIGEDNKTTDPQQMKLHTPKGGTYQIVLPDGTKVWLNAASSLTFPATFKGLKERAVALSGEAYFEVAAAAKQPFRVTTTAQTVEVLGTHFNINAYGGEAITKTTLLEGSIRVGKLLLKPGEQAAGEVKVTDVNTDEIMGWKNGYFVFENEQLPSIMRKISRWYDVEVVFKGEIPEDEFGGRVTRLGNLSQVLKKLELTNKVHFKIEGRTVTVTK
jgi:transmembrane sensor